MKKILIVNNNLKIGGVQKSLHNLLWAVDGQYDVTLCLFRNVGAYAGQLPASVRVVEARGLYRYLGVGQKECRGVDFLIRGMLVLLCRMFGRTRVLSHFTCRQPELEERYDCAISFLHNGRPKSFYGGTQDFVLNCANADKKVSFLHGDYRNCGSDHAENNRQLAQFDQIAACSDGCRTALTEVLPALAERCVAVRNCHRFDEIRRMAQDSPIIYDEECINVVLVARLSREKGIERAIHALAAALEKGVRAKLHIVGGGAEEETLQSLTREMKVDNFVLFHGEQSNPYRYIKNADLLLMTSYHEAAPMVIDEARCLGVPVLTTETVSAHEMVTGMACGWVCENSQQALDRMLCEVLCDGDLLLRRKETLCAEIADNRAALEQFHKLVQGTENA